MENLDIRLLVDNSGFTYKSIAKQMGISRVYLSRVMGRKLNSDMRNRILKAIEKLKEEDWSGDVNGKRIWTAGRDSEGAGRKKQISNEWQRAWTIICGCIPEETYHLISYRREWWIEWILMNIRVYLSMPSR